MSYSTWHNYGYGIRVDDIKEQSVERLQALLSREEACPMTSVVPAELKVRGTT